MSTDDAIALAVGISWPGVVIAFAAKTLPLIQWIAGFCAIVVSALAIYRAIKDR